MKTFSQFSESISTEKILQARERAKKKASEER